jgi:3-deoxy-D-manno-octulosonic-acid transferase
MAESPGMAYRFFATCLIPFWFIHAIVHNRQYPSVRYLKLRFFPNYKKDIVSRIWIHGSSLGEIETVSPLVNELLDRGESILLTSFTAAGYQAIERNFGSQVAANIIPVDQIVFCAFFLRRYNLKLLLLTETELWPELLFQVRRKCPILQINARLSDKSIKAPIAIRYLLRRAVSNINCHLTRNQNDRENLLGLGALEENIKVIGNLKNALKNTAVNPIELDRDYILLASTHPGEEQNFLEARLKKHSNILIVIAPRHPQRRDEIVKLANRLNLKLSIRSLTQAVESGTAIYLVDTLGELKNFMANALVVIMGGSFDQTGGHNLIEPAEFNKAIITGPSDSNIQSDLKLLGIGRGVIQVATIDDCWGSIGNLLDNPDKAEQIGNYAGSQVRRAADKILSNYLEQIEYWLPNTK